MNKQHMKQKLSTFALSLFRKDFFGIYHGSISAKLESALFVINAKESIFDAIDENQLVELRFNKDYRWNEASIDADIHKSIYKHITDAKFISFTMAPFTTSYSLYHNVIIPQDYFGHKHLGQVPIYDPKNFEDWYVRANTEISQYFLTHDTNVMVIRGYGIFAYHRDLHEMAKLLAILERSCRILMLDKNISVDDIV